MRPGSAIALVVIGGGLLGACGKAKDLLADAPSETIDSPPPVDAAMHGTFKATTRDIQTGALNAGIPLVVFKPDGTVASELTSDANGMATGEVDLGSTIVAVYVNPGETIVLGIADVHPGDDLLFGFPASRDHSNPTSTYAITFPRQPPVGQVDTTYDVWGPCGSVSGTPGTPAMIPFFDDCKPDTFDVFVVTGTNLVLKAQSLSRAAGSATIPPPANAGWPGLDSATVVATGVADGDDVDFERFATGVFDRWQNSTDADGANGFAASNLQTVLLGTSATVLTEFRYEVDTNGDNMSDEGDIGGEQAILDEVPGTSSYYTVDKSDALPPITALTYDDTSRKLTITADPTPDAQIIFLDHEYSTSATRVEYVVTLPATARNFTFPVIPAHLNVPDPDPTSTSTAVIEVELFQDDTLGGNDIARQQPLAALLNIGNGFTKHRSRLVETELEIPGAPTTPAKAP